MSMENKAAPEPQPTDLPSQPPEAEASPGRPIDQLFIGQERSQAVDKLLAQGAANVEVQGKGVPRFMVWVAKARKEGEISDAAWGDPEEITGEMLLNPDIHNRMRTYADQVKVFSLYQAAKVIIYEVENQNDLRALRLLALGIRYAGDKTQADPLQAGVANALEVATKVAQMRLALTRGELSEDERTERIKSIWFHYVRGEEMPRVLRNFLREVFPDIESGRPTQIMQQALFGPKRFQSKEAHAKVVKELRETYEVGPGRTLRMVKGGVMGEFKVGAIDAVAGKVTLLDPQTREEVDAVGVDQLLSDIKTQFAQLKTQDDAIREALTQEYGGLVTRKPQSVEKAVQAGQEQEEGPTWIERVSGRIWAKGSRPFSLLKKWIIKKGHEFDKDPWGTVKGFFGFGPEKKKEKEVGEGHVEEAGEPEQAPNGTGKKVREALAHAVEHKLEVGDRGLEDIPKKVWEGSVTEVFTHKRAYGVGMGVAALASLGIGGWAWLLGVVPFAWLRWRDYKREKEEREKKGLGKNKKKDPGGKAKH